MSKVAIIGAGSLVFTKQFLNDLFATPCMAGSSYYLMGPTMWKLEKMKQYADQIIEKNNIDAHIVCTTDRREALKDAEILWDQAECSACSEKFRLCLKSEKKWKSFVQMHMF